MIFLQNLKLKLNFNSIEAIYRSYQYPINMENLFKINQEIVGQIKKLLIEERLKINAEKIDKFYKIFQKNKKNQF